MIPRIRSEDIKRELSVASASKCEEFWSRGLPSAWCHHTGLYAVRSLHAYHTYHIYSTYDSMIWYIWYTYHTRAASYQESRPFAKNDCRMYHTGAYVRHRSSGRVVSTSRESRLVLTVRATVRVSEHRRLYRASDSTHATLEQFLILWSAMAKKLCVYYKKNRNKNSEEERIYP